MSAAPCLNVGSFNIYNTTGRYAEGRRELLKNTIDGLDVHILGLQEVVFGESGQTAMLADRWEAFEAPLQTPRLKPEDPTFRMDGNAVLLSKGHSDVKLSVVGPPEHMALSAVRTVQKLPLKLEVAGSSLDLTVVNTHLHWATGPCKEEDGWTPTRSDAEIRQGQLKTILEWIEAIPGTTIFMGDLNFFFEDELQLDMIKAHGFTDAFQELHGSHPMTCPTPLKAPFQSYEDSIPHPSDYILLRQRGSGVKLQPKTAVVCADKCGGGDETLYPSDHFAVRVSFEIVA